MQTARKIANGADLLSKRAISEIIAIVMVASIPLGALACEGLRPGPSGIVAEVTDGDTIVLDSGLKVRLIGMQAPKLPLGRAGFETWPLAGEAKVALEEIALGKQVQLRYAGEEMDRHGRALAHMFVDEGKEVWVQQTMLGAGLARVYSFADNRFCLDELYAVEAHARIAKRGIWNNPYYQLRYADRPDEILGRVDHYELVEGRVLAAERAGSRVYLNFGRNWKEDFTVVIDRASQRLFDQAGVDPLAYEGALVRVRGWIDNRDGPRMEISHPEQIEILAIR